MRTLKNRFAVLLSLLALVGAAQAQVGSGEIPTAEAPVFRQQQSHTPVWAVDVIGDVHPELASSMRMAIQEMVVATGAKSVAWHTTSSGRATQNLEAWLRGDRTTNPLPFYVKGDPDLLLVATVFVATSQVNQGLYLDLPRFNLDLGRIQDRETLTVRWQIVDLRERTLVRAGNTSRTNTRNSSVRVDTSLLQGNWRDLFGLFLGNQGGYGENRQSQGLNQAQLNALVTALGPTLASTQVPAPLFQSGFCSVASALGGKGISLEKAGSVNLPQGEMSVIFNSGDDERVVRGIVERETSSHLILRLNQEDMDDLANSGRMWSVNILKANRVF